MNLSIFGIVRHRRNLPKVCTRYPVARFLLDLAPDDQDADPCRMAWIIRTGRVRGQRSQNHRLRQHPCTDHDRLHQRRHRSPRRHRPHHRHAKVGHGAEQVNTTLL